MFFIHWFVCKVSFIYKNFYKIFLIVRIVIKGIVQGVGFRPFVYRTAVSNKISGYVRNTGNYVEAILQGNDDNINRFLFEIREKSPPLAKIKEIRIKEVNGINDFDSFDIVQSSIDDSPFLSLIAPDKSICDGCIEEIFDCDSRRYRYHFNSCTSCGPKFSLIKGVPLDRTNTSMSDFDPCNECRYEYKNPKDKRFFDQFISCGNCGPCLWLTDSRGIPLNDNDPIASTAKLIKEGFIVAIKGVGGFHVSCSALNSRPILRLRSAKKRPQKPFAVMSGNLQSIKTFAVLNDAELKVLSSPERPIVLLKKRNDYSLSPYVSPNLYNVGVMLPYTGLHYLLFDLMQNQHAIVMTSANTFGVPIMVDNNEAIDKMGNTVDFFLIHNRQIERRCDDSIIRVNYSCPVIIRRSRGFVPEPFSLKVPNPSVSIISLGAEKNVALTLMIKNKAFLSSYIGDINNLESYKFFLETFRYFVDMVGDRPLIITCDLHPSLITSRFALSMSKKYKVEQVQHHHAHLASLMAEHAKQEMIGIACDGFGYGGDGKSWGGEILSCGEHDYQRLGHLLPQPMIGGDLASIYPLRIVAGILADKVNGLTKFLSERLKNTSDKIVDAKQLLALIRMQSLSTKILSTTSTGRILDAVSSILDICYERSFEGEPALKLESIAVGGQDLHIPLSIKDNVLDTTFLLQFVYENKSCHSKKDMAYSAHSYIARGLAEIAILGATKLGFNEVGFSGGVAYNHIITDNIKRRLDANGLGLLLHKHVPPGDGGISLGQAYVTRMHSNNS